jgi:hypothetical protein|tara:strand:- start:1204 stop:1386 length:183 start_codon:yes stop_codon:yes gene_type:complete
MNAKAFLIRCDCESKKHNEQNKLCPVELMMDIIVQHEVQGIVLDVLDVEAMDAPIEGVSE